MINQHRLALKAAKVFRPIWSKRPFHQYSLYNSTEFIQAIWKSPPGCTFDQDFAYGQEIEVELSFAPCTISEKTVIENIDFRIS